MPAGRESRKRRIDFNEERPDMTLLGVQFGGEVADVRGLDLARLDICGFERGERRLTHHGDEMFAFFGPIAGKVGLRSAQYVHWRWLGHRELLSFIRNSSDKSAAVLKNAAHEKFSIV